MMKISFVLVFLFLAQTAWAETAYLCIPEKAVGFSFDKSMGSWEPSTFKVADKYVVKKPSKDDAAEHSQWVVKKVSSEGQIIAYCPRDFNELGHLSCDLIAEFKFNMTTMRFMAIYSNGYWDDILDSSKGHEKDKRLRELYKQGVNVPYIEIGQCAPMNL